MYYDHIHYVQNDITNPFINYADCLCEIFCLLIFNSPPSKNAEEFNYADWTKRKILFKEETINKAIKDGPPPAIKYDIYNNC